MKQKRMRGILAIALLATFALTGQSCLRGGSQTAQQAYQDITLQYWTVFNSPDHFSEVLADYQTIHPNIDIEIKKFRFDEYEQMLLNALAEDRGPDIFSVHNTQIPEYRTKLYPMPETTTLATQVVEGSLKKEVITQLVTTRSLNEYDLRSQFFEQVYKDVYVPSVSLDAENRPIYGAKSIHGLPIAMDTLVMFYNRDLLDNAGVAQPAQTWSEFQEQVGRIARFDSRGNILVAAAALGTADNTPRAADILALLMLQNGAEMVTEEGEVNFHRIPEALRGQRSGIPGEEALLFYTGFANANQRSYTWNANQVDGFEAFLQGKSAYFFGYAYHVDEIKALAPRLNYGISNMPQIQGNPEVHFANYWVEGVSRKTAYPDAAWDFVQFMTSAQEAQKYLESAQKPTARRDLITPQLDNPDLVIFASQLLRARSWYNGQDAAAAEGIIKQLIRDALAGVDDFDELLQLAAERVQQTYRF